MPGIGDVVSRTVKDLESKFLGGTAAPPKPTHELSVARRAGSLTDTTRIRLLPQDDESATPNAYRDPPSQALSIRALIPVAAVEPRVEADMAFFDSGGAVIDTRVVRLHWESTRSEDTVFAWEDDAAEPSDEAAAYARIWGVPEVEVVQFRVYAMFEDDAAFTDGILHRVEAPSVTEKG